MAAAKVNLIVVEVTAEGKVLAVVVAVKAEILAINAHKQAIGQVSVHQVVDREEATVTREATMAEVEEVAVAVNHLLSATTVMKLVTIAAVVLNQDSREVEVEAAGVVVATEEDSESFLAKSNTR